MGLSYDALTFYVARDSAAVRAALAEAGAANKRFWRRAKAAARAVGPPGPRREPMVVGHMGASRVVGVEATSDDYKAPPAGWLLNKSPTYLAPRRSKKAGHPDMADVIARLEKVGQLRDPRLALPGLDNRAWQLPGVAEFDDRVYLYVSSGGLGGPPTIDEKVWRPIKRSTFYRALEATEDAR